jgi:two-component system chemotaxis response regulator CheY
MTKRNPQDVTVLVVDDDPDVTTFLSSVLADAGFNVAVATSGLAALEHLRRGPLPDLVSLDLVMPGHSGVRVLHDMRKHPQWSRIPVMVVSGHSRDDEVRRGLDEVLADSSISGPSLYLEKPVTPQKYVDAVCQVLQIDAGSGTSPASRAGDLRNELAALLDSADDAALEAAIRAVRSAGGRSPRS